MRYNKPEITHLGTALGAVHDQTEKPGSLFTDSINQQPFAQGTTNAYQADE
jgi:hypothetical protein